LLLFVSILIQDLQKKINQQVVIPKQEKETIENQKETIENQNETKREEQETIINKCYKNNIIPFVS
jgi:hypothetical protein